MAGGDGSVTITSFLFDLPIGRREGCIALVISYVTRLLKKSHTLGSPPQGADDSDNPD